MSLLLVYHDAKRALACSDDRAVVFNDYGVVAATPARVPKFIICGALIFSVLGDSNVCQSLNRSTRRMLRDHPELGVTQLASILPKGFERLWTNRVQDPNRPLGFDNLEAAIMGFDPQARRVRAFVFTAGDNFKPVETTADPYNRIFALGHYGVTDQHILEGLTRRMKLADSKALPWVAAQLRSALRELHSKYPVAVGEPSFYAAFDQRGLVDLPEEFPTLPAQEEELAAAAHHVTTNKETALVGTTRFFVGSITTPAAGKLDTAGNNDGGNGAQNGQVNKYFLNSFGAFAAVANGGNGSKTGEGNMVNGNFNDFASYTVTGNSSAANSAASNFNFSQLALIRRQGPLTIKIVYSVPTNSLNGGGITALAIIGVAYTDAGGTVQQAFPVLVPAGTVVATQTLVTVSIPWGSSNFAINPSVQTRNIDTAGTLTLRVIEAWAEIAE